MKKILILMLLALTVSGMENSFYGEIKTYYFDIGYSNLDCNNYVNVYGEKNGHVIKNKSLTHYEGNIYQWEKPVNLEKDSYEIDITCYTQNNEPLDFSYTFNVVSDTDESSLLVKLWGKIPFAKELYDMTHSLYGAFHLLIDFLIWFVYFLAKLILFAFLYSWVFVLLIEASICAIAYHDSRGNPFQMFINFFVYNFRLMHFLMRFTMEIIQFMHRIIIETIIRILDLIPTT